MLFTSGYWRRGTFQGLPLRWHWSVIVGLCFAGGFELAPLAWLFYLGLVQCHLMSHGLAVQHAGLVPVGFDIQALGGKVRWQGHAPVAAEVRVGWAGVAGQLLPLLLAKVILLAHGGATASWLVDLERVCIDMNAAMIAINLLPLPTFDGESAWKILRLARGQPIERRRVVILEPTPTATLPRPAVRAYDVADEIAREVETLARSHNDRAGVR